MKRSRLIYWILGLMLLVFLALVAVGPTRYQSLVEQRLLAQINRGPIKVTLHQSRLSLASLSAAGARIFVPRIWTEFKLENLEVQLQLLSLVRLAPALNVSAQMWDGNVQLSASHSLISGINRANFILQDLSLGHLQQFEALGFDRGKLTASFQELTLSQDGLAGNLDLTIRDLQHPTDKLVPAAVLRTRSDLLIPKFENFDLQASVRLAGKSLDLTKLEHSSSLGRAHGQARLQLNDALQIAGASGEFELQLSSDGATFFNFGRQALESSGQANSTGGSLTTRRWRVNFNGTPRMRFEFTALEQNAPAAN